MLRKVFHILLAILVFVSSSGLMFSKHYCQGELKNTALYTEAASCHSSAKTKACPRHSAKQSTSASASANNCCATVVDFVKNDDSQLSTITELSDTTPLPLFAVLPDVMLLAGPTIPFQAAHFLHYKPPLIVCDLSVRLQTFLC